MANKERGQSLIELLIAMGLFVLGVSAITFLVLDAYVATRSGQERTRAVLLAEEGMEAARSIRDYRWDNLTNGEHGLRVSSNRWYFYLTEENLSSKLNNGKRKIIVEEIDSERKKITSLVTWDLTAGRPQQVSLVNYLTNWRRSINPTTCDGYCLNQNYSGGICRSNSNQCAPNGEIYKSGGNTYCSSPNRRCCCDL